MLAEDRQRSLVQILIALREDDPEYKHAVSALSLRAGQVVAEPRRLACSIYILMMGRIQLICEDAAGPSLPVATLNPGAVFGEGAQLGALDATMSANALTDCVAWVVPAPQAQELLLLTEQLPPLGDS